MWCQEVGQDHQEEKEEDQKRENIKGEVDQDHQKEGQGHHVTDRGTDTDPVQDLNHQDIKKRKTDRKEDLTKTKICIKDQILMRPS